MKFSEFTHPKAVYDGFFETYFIRPFVHHYADFSGRESGRALVRSLLAWLVITLGIAGILMGQVGLLGPEVGFATLWTIGGVWLAASVVPLLALFARAAHGAPEKERKVRMLGVDTLLGVSSLLFFILGLLMMVTTLNSGVLNPNAGATDETDTANIEGEYVTEEAIFTYQDAAPAEVITDSMKDLDEPDAATPEESFDPTLAEPAADTSNFF